MTPTIQHRLRISPLRLPWSPWQNYISPDHDQVPEERRYSSHFRCWRGHWQGGHVCSRSFPTAFPAKWVEKTLMMEPIAFRGFPPKTISLYCLKSSLYQLMADIMAAHQFLISYPLGMVHLGCNGSQSTSTTIFLVLYFLLFGNPANVPGLASHSATQEPLLQVRALGADWQWSFFHFLPFAPAAAGFSCRELYCGVFQRRDQPS